MGNVSGNPIQRFQGGPANVTFTASGTQSPGIDVRNFAWGAFSPDSDFNTNTLTFEGSDAIDGSYTAISDNSGTAISVTVATGLWYEFHPAVLSVPFMRIVTDAAVAGAAVIKLSLNT